MKKRDTKTTVVILALLTFSASSALGFGIYVLGAPCGTAGALVTSASDCSNVLTTGGGDPLTP